MISNGVPLCGLVVPVWRRARASRYAMTMIPSMSHDCRPFVSGNVQWFFALMGPGAAVYRIGHTVVLKRRTESGGWALLWAWIGEALLGYVVGII